MAAWTPASPTEADAWRKVEAAEATLTAARALVEAAQAALLDAEADWEAACTEVANDWGGDPW